jgi:hypothetical protein
MLVGVFCLKSYNLAVLPYHKQEEKNDIRKNADDNFGILHSYRVSQSMTNLKK